jgi:hypothetical protein
MPYAITNFSHTKYGYTSDGGQPKFVSCRTVYTVALTGLAATPAAGAAEIRVLHARRRYIHSKTGSQTPVNPVERHFPVVIAKAQNPAVNAALGATVDGITDFLWKGYRGETDRA